MFAFINVPQSNRDNIIKNEYIWQQGCFVNWHMSRNCSLSAMKYAKRLVIAAGLQSEHLPAAEVE